MYSNYGLFAIHFLPFYLQRSWKSVAWSASSSLSRVLDPRGHARRTNTWPTQCRGRCFIGWSTRIPVTERRNQILRGRELRMASQNDNATHGTERKRITEWTNFQDYGDLISDLTQAIIQCTTVTTLRILSKFDSNTLILGVLPRQRQKEYMS